MDGATLEAADGDFSDDTRFVFVYGSLLSGDAHLFHNHDAYLGRARSHHRERRGRPSQPPPPGPNQGVRRHHRPQGLCARGPDVRRRPQRAGSFRRWLEPLGVGPGVPLGG